MLDGHFLLTSGLHSDRYVQKARLFEDPEATMLVAREIASWYAADPPSAVVAPAVGAVPFGFAVALAAGARSLFAEREAGAMRLRRGFALEPGERTLVVEDVVTTGGSAKEVVDLVVDAGAILAGVAALVDRSGGRAAFPLRALATVAADSWDPSECPLCAAGAPLDAPGSRNVSPADPALPAEKASG